MASPGIKVLRDDQVTPFDVDPVTTLRWQAFTARIDARFPDGVFTFLDVGGGNGCFADRVLAAYPRAHAVILDNSRLLLARNAPHPRKRLVCDSVERVEELFAGERFDLVTLNWVLHHLVRDGYGPTRRSQVEALAALGRVLAPDGRIAIFEHLYDGKVFDGLPSWLIFQLTQSRVLAPVVGRLGANTAGCGVCFLSKRRWERSIAAAGLQVEHATDLEPFRSRPLHKACLHLGPVRTGLLWCAH